MSTKLMIFYSDPYRNNNSEADTLVEERNSHSIADFRSLFSIRKLFDSVKGKDFAYEPR